MNYELARSLKNVGFPQKLSKPSTHYGEIALDINRDEVPYIPNLGELIEACNPIKADDFGLYLDGDRWCAYYRYFGNFEHNNKFKDSDEGYSVDLEEHGQTPEEAVANLYIALNKKYE